MLGANTQGTRPSVPVARKINFQDGRFVNIKSLTEDVEALMSLLTSDMKLPSPLEVTYNGKTLKGAKAHGVILKSISATVNNINLVQADSTLTTNQKKTLLNLSNKVMFVQKASEDYVNGNNFSYFQKISANQTLKSITKTFAKMGLSPPTQNAIYAEAAKRHFKEGKSEGFRDYMNRLNASDKKGVDFHEPALVYGPLNKNKYTYEYEDLVKAMLAGKPFTHRVESGAGEEPKPQIIIILDNKEYHLNEILKHANLNHLSFDQHDHAKYMDMLCSDKVINPPAKPNPHYNPATGENVEPINMRGRENIEALDKSFIERDPTLVGMEQADRLALNIYTTSIFFTDSNGMLRGDFKVEKFAQEGYLKELICSTGMALCAINKLPAEKPVSTFRGDKAKAHFAEILEERIEAAKTGAVTMVYGFVSTAIDKPSTNFAFKNDDIDDNIGIVFTNLLGKDLRGLTAFPHEREFLIPPTQVQWEYHANVKGGHLFAAKPVTTLTGLSTEALSAKSHEEKPSDKISDLASEVDDLLNKLDTISSASQELLIKASENHMHPEVVQSMKEVHEALDLANKSASNSDALLRAATKAQEKREHCGSLHELKDALVQMNATASKSQELLMLASAPHELHFAKPATPSHTRSCSWYQVAATENENTANVGDKRSFNQIEESFHGIDPSKKRRTM